MSKLKLTMMGFATLALIVGGAAVVQSLTQSPEERVLREIEAQAHELLHGRTALQEARDELVAAIREAGLDGADIRRAFKQVDTHLETADKRYRNAEAHAGKLERVDEGSEQWARLIERIAVELEVAEGALSQAEQGLTGIARVLLEPNEICPAVYQPVCGVDGNTYPNACHAQRVEIAYGGACRRPRPEDSTWTLVGPGGGGFMTVTAIDPKDANIVYIGSDLGGIFKSTNGGKSFTFANNGLRNYVIQDIEIDPKNTNIVYTATGDGVYKSTDKGNTWTLKRNGFPRFGNEYDYSAAMNSLGIAPSNPKVIYAGSGYTAGKSKSIEAMEFIAPQYSLGEIYKSTNGGESWTNRNLPVKATVVEIGVSPTDPNTVFATTNKGLYKSTDGGSTWQRKRSGIPHDEIKGIAFHPSNPTTIYITVTDPGGGFSWKGGVYKSTDGGETWTAKNNGLLMRNDGHGGEVSNYNDVLIDQKNPDTLYTGDQAWGSLGIYKSTNGGDSWNPMIDEAKIVNVPYFAGGDVSTMAMGVSDPKVIYFGNAFHIYSTVDGTTWQGVSSKNVGKNVWQTGGIAASEPIGGVIVDPSDSNIIYIGYGDFGLWRSNDGGKTFRHILSHLNGGQYEDILSYVLDPDIPGTIYVVNGEEDLNVPGRLQKSTDYGNNWKVLGGAGSGLPQKEAKLILALDPSSPKNSRTLYVTALGKGIYKSTNDGKTWNAVNNGLGRVSGKIILVKIDEKKPRTLYAAVYGEQGDGKLYKTTDGANQWKLIKQVDGISSMAIDPKNSSIIYIATARNWKEVEGGVYKSTDGGNTWTKVLNERWINALAIRPDNPNIIYAGSYGNPFFDGYIGKGIYKSSDGGNTWSLASNQPPHTNIHNIAFDPHDPRIMYVGTGGGGVLRGTSP